MNGQIDKLKDMFFLQGWEICINYHKEPCADSPGVTAEVHTTWKYRRVELQIFPIFWDQPEDEAKSILVHEFVHVVLVQPFELISGARNGRLITSDEVSAVNEHTTTWIQNIIQSQPIK